MNESASKAGALNFTDPGKQAAVMSLAHMRGVGGAQAILNSMESGNIVKSAKLTPQAIDYIESMDAKDFQESLKEVRVAYDIKIYGNSNTSKGGITYNWWDHYGDGLQKRYAKEAKEFLKLSN
ncbi:hypothetical protein HC231_08140 [Brenneria izadpanahii]|uniref:Uncharacterized protein n=2 Tax=Brenneria TaxID=71655 RepID=A0ABX7UQA9_9GAMM|nr:hypothetical protein [Brenneria izadpanahii]QTF07904.1 hypothetical protein HC231_08140 [Brenneria izadpanahii]